MKENINKTLFLFTAEYPYGNKSETFLETEIKYLSEGFKEVYIIPSKKCERKRTVPENVFVLDEYANLEFTKKEKIISLFRHPRSLFSALSSEFRAKGILKTISHLKFLIDYFSQQSLIANTLQKNSCFFEKNVVLYDYWFCNFTLALSILKFNKTSVKFITRAHGYDLYDERWGAMGLPFRLFKTRMVEKVFCVSIKGQNYFKSKLPISFQQKIKVSYLGVERYPNILKEKQDARKIIVSCSGITELKNLAEIIDVFKASKTPITWIHFGDGPEGKTLLDKAKQLPVNVNFDCRGHVNNTEIIKFYQNNVVDLFISLSKSEGIPVSMMEALSFGIPILASKVGGVAEIVIDSLTGFLVESDDKIEIKIKIFNKALQFDFDVNKLKEFYILNFEAKNNYKNFIQKIMHL